MLQPFLHITDKFFRSARQAVALGVCLLSIGSSSLWAQNTAPLTLSLSEAILLSVRENPNVQQAELNHVGQKFALSVQQWQFRPHYSVNAITGMTQVVDHGALQTTNQTSVQPTATLLTPYGTQLTFAAINNFSGHYRPGLSLQVMQPLLRGFGRPVVEASLYNAMDSEKISRLLIDGVLRTTITAVINAYLDVISAEHTVLNDQKAVERAQLSVQQTQLFIKAGHKAGNEIVTVQADLAHAQAALENDKNNLQQMRYALLAAIGLEPNANVVFSSLDVPRLIQQYHLPSAQNAEAMALQNDIQYQVDNITYEGATKRSLLIAEDGTRWQLGVTMNGGVGQGAGGNNTQNWGQVFHGANQMRGAQLNLQVPLNDQAAQQAVVSAKIALQEAQLALKQEKWNKETNAINEWNTLSSTERALHFAENAAALQTQTYNMTYKKYLYGLIDSTALQSVQQQTASTDQSLVVARISYLKALVNLDFLVGTTLQTWHVEPRYN